MKNEKKIVHVFFMIKIWQILKHFARSLHHDTSACCSVLTLQDLHFYLKEKFLRLQLLKMEDKMLSI